MRPQSAQVTKAKKKKKGGQQLDLDAHNKKVFKDKKFNYGDI